MSDLPSGWAEATLEELAASEPAAITDGPFGSNLKTEHYTDHGPRVIRLQNIGDGSFRDAEAHVSEDHFKRLLKHEAVAGDVIIAALGEVLPRACLVPSWLGPAIVKADCVRFRANRLAATPAFIALALNSPQLRSQATALISGVGRPRLNLKKIRGLTLPVPPLAEQQRIVAAIEERFTRLDAADASLRSAEQRCRNFRTAALGVSIDERWPLQPLGDLLDGIEAGKSFRTTGQPADLDHFGVIKVSAMTWGEFREDEQKEVPDGRSIDPRLEIRPGDLLLSRANTADYVGATVLVGQCRPKLLLSDKSMRLLPNQSVDGRWLVRALSSRSARSQMSLLATGTSDSMRNISQAKVRQILLPVPPQNEQDRLADEVDRLLTLEDGAARLIQSGLRRSEGLRRSILEQAFTGQLVPQDPGDAPASELLEKIRADRAAAPARKSGRRRVS